MADWGNANPRAMDNPWLAMLSPRDQNDPTRQQALAAWSPVMNVPRPEAKKSFVGPTLPEPQPQPQVKGPMGPPVSTMMPPPDDTPPDSPAAVFAGSKSKPDGFGQDYADLLRQLKDKSDGIAGEQRKNAEGMKPFLDQLQKPNLQYDLSPLMALTDQWSGGHLANSYKAPESGQERMNEMMKLKKGLADMGIQASDTELAGLKDLASGTFGLDKLRNERDFEQKKLDLERAKIDAEKRKSGLATNKDLTTLGHELVSGTASSRSDFGRNQSVITGASKLESLGQQAKNQKGGLDKGQMQDLAVATGALVNNGNSAAQHTVDALVPKSFSRDEAGIMQWLTNEPQGTGQQAFIDRMLETASRERHNAEQNLKLIKGDILAGHVNLDRNDPKVQALIKHHFGNDSQFDENGNYMPKSYQAGGSQPAASPNGSDMYVPDASAQAKAQALLQQRRVKR